MEGVGADVEVDGFCDGEVKPVEPLEAVGIGEKTVDGFERGDYFGYCVGWLVAIARSGLSIRKAW